MNDRRKYIPPEEAANINPWIEPPDAPSAQPRGNEPQDSSQQAEPLSALRTVLAAQVGLSPAAVDQAVAFVEFLASREEGRDVRT